MSTLIVISALGVLCLLLEVLNLRKIVFPVAIVVLVASLAMTFIEYCMGKSFIDADRYNMLHATAYSQVFSMIFIILSILVILMCPHFYKDKITHITDYVSLKIFLLAGAIAMVSFGNMIMFFIGLEVLSICGYVLAASEPKFALSNEAGIKYFVMGAIASAFILFGIAMVYGAVSSFDISVIAKSVFSQQVNSIWFELGFLMISVGMLFKASIVPFHFWAPDVYEGSPTLVTALMSTLVKVAAIGSLFKIVSVMSIAENHAYVVIIIVLSILSMIVGNITALRQTNMKRMMAFSGIAHAGFMIMTLLCIKSAGTTVAYYAAAYSLAALAVFAVIMSVSNGKREHEDISAFYGLAQRRPFLAILMTGALLSLSGIPIFAGFFAKFFVFNVMLHAHYMILVIFGILNSVVSVYYYFRVINVMFTKPASDVSSALVQSKSYCIVGTIALLLILILGIFPSIIMGVTM